MPQTNSNRIDQPAAIRSGETLDTHALENYLCKHLDTNETLAIKQFPSGFSNLTYLLRFGEKEFVLRRPPFGANIKSAHDMSREYHILSHLIKIYPKVPKPLLFCADNAIIGAPFYVMERVKGVILRAQMPEENYPAPQQMAKAANALVTTFVELHAVDYQAAGLGELGRPQGYAQRQIEGWIKRYQHARTDDIPEMEKLADWLAANIPPDGKTALIHNDFKYDNLVLNPADWSEVIAVLDWEMATIGDPLMDLGTSLAYWIDTNDPPVLQKMKFSPTTIPGGFSRAEMAEAYARLSGNDLVNIVFYYAYGLYKIAVIGQQIYARYKKGLTKDQRFAGLIHAVRACSALGVQAIAKKRIDNL